MAWYGAWPSQPLSVALDSFGTLIKLVDAQALEASDDVSAILARFLVIRSSGYIETVSEMAMTAYLKSKSAPRAAQFGASRFGRGANPSPGNLEDLVRRFDPLWADELHAFLAEDDELLKRELSFLVDARNKIAHGANESVRARKALDLASHAQTVARWFIERFDPT